MTAVDAVNRRGEESTMWVPWGAWGIFPLVCLFMMLVCGVVMLLAMSRGGGFAGMRAHCCAGRHGASDEPKRDLAESTPAL